MILSFASANRDPAVHPDPDQFDVRRPNARTQVTTGSGKHFCLGAPLARREIKILLKELTKRFPTWSWSRTSRSTT